MKYQGPAGVFRPAPGVLRCRVWVYEQPMLLPQLKQR